MSCSCGSINGKVGGCKNNGACGTGGCNKMNVFDWLANMEVPAEDKFQIAEVRFKNGRKEYFRNQDKLPLITGDPVVVEVPNGHHVGYLSMQGELVRLQMQKKKIKDDSEIKKIYRLASQRDLDKLKEAQAREMPTLYRSREIIRDLKLEMKLSDVEYQADNTKATFFYSADDRVDFRELIKLLASEFKIRVEMRQISLRQEAGRLGGIGVCGRELCCSTWLSDFKNVTTSAARYQSLSLNPSKLSGQCGRLKCCLNYELETYMEALQGIPKLENPLLTEAGEATLQKTDIFRRIMWFGFGGDNNWIALDIDRVNHILKLNAEGRKPATLEQDVLEERSVSEPLNSDLERMDKKYRNKSKRNKKRRPNPDQRSGSGGGAQGERPRPQGPEGQQRPGNRQGQQGQGQGGNRQGNQQNRQGGRNQQQNQQGTPNPRREGPQGNRQGPEGSNRANPNPNRQQNNRRDQNRNAQRPPRDPRPGQNRPDDPANS